MTPILYFHLCNTIVLPEILDEKFKNWETVIFSLVRDRVKTWVGHDWATELNWCSYRRRQWQPTPVLSCLDYPAWIIPEMGEPGGLQSVGSHRVGHDWSDLAALYLFTKDITRQKTEILDFTCDMKIRINLHICDWNLNPDSQTFSTCLKENLCSMS